MNRRLTGLMLLACSTMLATVSACAGPPADPTTAPTPDSTTSTPTTPTTADASLASLVPTAPTPTDSPPASTPDPALPPDATLTAEGGDPVMGQLGTFVWGDGGSDSPLLPGTPMTVGAGEPLSVRLTSTIGVSSWSALLARTEPSASGVAPVAIKDGPPPLALPAPRAGEWRLIVTVRFADHAGSATYTWHLRAQ